ncbi:hypothetical protein, partial [Streptomyces sp. SID3343]|uniref:hypothetical protein n=1 Tax=Streptomyces sp. SID3343 TaxID=2690260 RepID=UPI0013C09A91
ASTASTASTASRGPSGQGDEAARAARWGTLPERVSPEDMVEEQPGDAPNDPLFGRDPDNDWLLRYAP